MRRGLRRLSRSLYRVPSWFAIAWASTMAAGYFVAALVLAGQPAGFLLAALGLAFLGTAVHAAMLSREAETERRRR